MTTMSVLKKLKPEPSEKTIEAIKTRPTNNKNALSRNVSPTAKPNMQRPMAAYPMPAPLPGSS
jgi:hypothetical protein